MQDSFSILMVCTGNICRSPLAQQLLAEQVSDIPAIRVSSAGTHALVGEPMFDVTQQVARSYGLENYEAHRAQEMTEKLLDSSDLILTMTRDHRRAVVELSPRSTRQTFTIREFARLAEVTTDEALTSAIEQEEDLPVARLRAAIRTLTSRRSLLPTLADPVEDDVVDPYKRKMEVHEASVDQLEPAIDAVISLIRRSLKGVG